MASNREWTTWESAYLKRHYPAGMPAAQIAEHLGRSVTAIMAKAGKLGLRHPTHSSQQSIANFEALHGKPITEITREYRDQCLSRGELAAEIGIDNKALRAAIGEALWRSWPHMTIARKRAVENRRPCA